NLRSGGKRIRPYIAYVMYGANGGKDMDKALELFVSLEIFHTFALIHDDIMDKQYKRHGVDTIPAYVLKKLNEEKRTGDLENVANGQGILMGNLFFSWAMELFLGNENFPHENITSSQNYFYKMVDEVCLGQILDIDVTTRENVSENFIIEKTRLKTSRYTFVRPMEIGAHLANPNTSMDNFCEDLGTRLGIAFQMQDDLLDIIGDPKVLEKNILRDVADRQHTFFTNYIFSNGTSEQKEKLLKYFGKELTEKEQKEIVEIFENSGSIEKGKEEILKNLNQAKEIIEKSDLGEEYKEICLSLIKVMEGRQH
ncbi:polyprenyl synthetase family protein, partial [Patescibacteria group bacterium]|nr:polyprenyl synthetase family protein [Patescibacteria group bacterium]